MVPATACCSRRSTTYRRASKARSTGCWTCSRRTSATASRCWSSPITGAMRRSFPDRRSPRGCAAGRTRASEMFLHGYFHRDDSRGTEARATGCARSFMTAGEGEFLGLSRAEADAPHHRRPSVARRRDRPAIDGFVAPAWLYGRRRIEALQRGRDCRSRRTISASGRRHQAPAGPRPGDHLGEPDAGSASRHRSLAAAALCAMPNASAANRRPPAGLSGIRRSSEASRRPCAVARSQAVARAAIPNFSPPINELRGAIFQ